MEAKIQEMCKTLDTKTFSIYYPILLKTLLSESSKPLLRLLIGKYFFRDIDYYFKPSSERRDLMIKAVRNTITRVNDIVPKAGYLQYRNYYCLKELCLHFYKSARFPKEYFLLQMLNDQTLINIYDINEMEAHFIKWIVEDQLSFEQKSNLLDVLIRYFPSSSKVHEIRAELSGGTNVSFYENQQNAHDESLNASSIEKAILLFEDMAPLHTVTQNPARETPSILVNWYGDNDIVKTVTTRISIDSTMFGDPNVKMFTIGSLLYEIMLFISSLERDTLKPYLQVADPLELQNSLKCRLYEELTDASGLCSTAYIVRLINVFRGYVDRYETTIDFTEQLFARITAIVSKKFLVADLVPDEVSLGTYDEQYRPQYVEYILNLIRNTYSSWCKDYGKEDVDKSLPKAVSKFLDREITLDDIMNG